MVEVLVNHMLLLIMDLEIKEEVVDLVILQVTHLALVEEQVVTVALVKQIQAGIYLGWEVTIMR